jgi:hypothetical protein
MPTSILEGEKVKEIELVNLFPPYAGMITQYYGRIGSGKTYAATMDVLELLRRGQVVYTNWKLNFDGYDERKSAFHVFITIILFWKKRFYKFPKENLHFLDVDKDFHDKLAKITDSHIFLDEGHVAFDSYEMARLSIEKRKNILHTRHFDRSIHIISQRPTAVHVVMRANVNVFYKCELQWSFMSLIRFRRTEYQDMLNENVDEDEEKVVSVKHYWGEKRIFNSYNTKYLRGGMAASQKVLFEAFDLKYMARILLFFKLLLHIKDIKDIKDIKRTSRTQFRKKGKLPAAVKKAEKVSLIDSEILNVVKHLKIEHIPSGVII